MHSTRKGCAGSVSGLRLRQQMLPPHASCCNLRLERVVVQLNEVAVGVGRATKERRQRRLAAQHAYTMYVCIHTHTHAHAHAHAHAHTATPPQTQKLAGARRRTPGRTIIASARSRSSIRTPAAPDARCSPQASPARPHTCGTHTGTSRAGSPTVHGCRARNGAAMSRRDAALCAAAPAARCLAHHLRQLDRPSGRR
jgi:hypothetical protein